MQFSFYLPCYWPDTSIHFKVMYDEMLVQAARAEQLGYAMLGIPEHHFINYLTHPSPLLTAVKLTSVTKRMPFITSVLVLPFLDMRRLAGEIAQADCLTDGRIQLGVGRGAFRYEFDRFNVPVEESRAMFDDGLALLKKLMSETEVSWDSDYYKFDALTITPRPVQQPHPPIWMAAVNPVAIYHSVLNGYDIMTTPLREPFERVVAQVEAFHKGVAEAGEAASGRMLSMLKMLYVAKDDADRREKIALAHANHQRFVNVYNTPGEVLNGAIKPIETNETLDDVGKVLIIGTASECIDRLGPYAELGIHDMMLNMSFGAAHDDVLGAMERFATDVRPHFT
jgi:alkanesulfonate monooxygenase SsuD/methylene tetrahydromethanopterin reductase-like flavin-dependent oxidoreductase (luciferase family)